MVAIIYSDVFLEHLTGFGHPERPGRLSAIVERLRQSQWAPNLDWHLPTDLQARNAVDWILKAHSADYVAQVQSLAEKGGGRLDGDTPISAQSFEVACLAVNAWLDGIDQVLATQQPAFVLSRPPGHHALPDRGMGFCVFANAAIAAFYALEKPNIQRVAILDWDVHHGNGTEAIVATHPKIAYCSLHEYPHYPGTGAGKERGPHGTILNLPMEACSTLSEYQAKFDQAVIPFLKEFGPDLLIVSAGYDANADDPLANINLNPSDFGELTQYCLSVTPRILFGLEGGYHFESLSASVEATIAACLTPPEPTLR